MLIELVMPIKQNKEKVYECIEHMQKFPKFMRQEKDLDVKIKIIGNRN